jgi:hypothetical protein
LGAGMGIPGMCICAAAGVANSMLAPNKNESDFREKFLGTKCPRPIGRGRCR